MMEPDTVLYLRELYQHIQRLALDAYREGFDDGRKLIHGLASGTLSIAEVEKRTLER